MNKFKKPTSTVFDGQKLNEALINRMCICLTFVESVSNSSEKNLFEEGDEIIKVRLLDLYHFYIMKKEFLEFID